MADKLEIIDIKGRPARLCRDYAYMTRGSRWVTRKSIAKLLKGEANRVWFGSEFTKGGPSRWSCSSGKRFIRFGCHMFKDANAETMRRWALA